MINIPIPIGPELLAEIQKPRSGESDEWRGLLKQHRNHQSFKTLSDPQRLEIGFRCWCGGERQEYKISIVKLKQMQPDAEAAFRQAWVNENLRGSKLRRKKQRRADLKARALLFRYLTREQKWQFRAKKSFTLIGKDGHKYEIADGHANNVFRYQGNRKALRFCIVPKGVAVPSYDLMLAQKILLESNPREFLDTAVVHDIKSGDHWSDGRHIDNPEVEPVESFKQRQLRQRKEREPNYESYEREELDQLQRAREEKREERRKRITGVVGDLLIQDICLNVQARFDACLGGECSFVLNADLEVVPVFDTPMVIPPIPDTVNADAAIIKLITGLPVEVFRSIPEVDLHFRRSDLCWWHVLLHPETDQKWSEKEWPPWPSIPTVLGVKKVLDERVPKGRAWYVADAETVGLMVHWYEEPQRGYGVFNLSGVAIYEPKDATEETSEEESGEEESAETALEILRQEANTRENLGERSPTHTPPDGGVGPGEDEGL